MYTEINAALQSFKVIGDWIRANKSLSNYNELVSAVSEVNSKLLRANEVALDSQEKQALLTERIRELEKKIMEFENRESEAQKYKPHAFPSGARAFVLKPEMQDGEPLHYFCEACMSKSQISCMQPDGFHNGKPYFLRCHNCNLLLPTSPMSNALEGSIRAKMRT